MIFLYRVCSGPGGVQVVLSGDVDLAVREDLRRVLAGAVAGASSMIDLDLHNVTFLDCAGIGELVRAYRDAHGRGHTLTVSRPQGVTRRILDLSGVLAVLMTDGQTSAPHRLDVPHSA